MKPLTIDELKALEVGDWVWVEPHAPKSLFRGYYQIRPNAERSKLIFCGIEHDYSILDYGKTWLAYKNKEQAEAKGEIVELPCIRKTLVGYELVYLSQYAQIETEMLCIDELPYAERRLAELRGEK